MTSALSAPPWKVLIGTDGRWGIFFCITGSQVSRDEVGELNIPGGVGSNCLAGDPVVVVTTDSGTAAAATGTVAAAVAAEGEEAAEACGAALFQEPLLLLEEEELELEAAVEVVVFFTGEGSRITPL